MASPDRSKLGLEIFLPKGILCNSPVIAGVRAGEWIGFRNPDALFSGQNARLKGL